MQLSTPLVYRGTSPISLNAAITAGLMLLVYAMTRATQHGWGTTGTIGLLLASAALIVGFLLIELRSSAPLLPMRIFRLRTLTASNLAGLLMGGAQVSEKHCNFLINTGRATAADLEGLGEEVRRRVHAATGVTLEWEIHRIGVPARGPEVVG